MADGTDESYEAFAGLFPQTALGRLARDWLVRHRRMVAWNEAVLINTASGYRSFLAKFPDSDLCATARKLEQRLRNRPEFTPAVAAANAALPQNVALAAPMCPCNVQPPQPQPLKVNAPVRRVEPDPPKKRVDRKPPRRPSRMTTSWSFAVRPRAWCTTRRRAKCTSHRDRRSASASASVSAGLAAAAAATMATMAAGVDTEVAIG